MKKKKEEEETRTTLLVGTVLEAIFCIFWLLLNFWSPSWYLKLRSGSYSCFRSSNNRITHNSQRSAGLRLMVLRIRVIRNSGNRIFNNDITSSTPNVPGRCSGGLRSSIVCHLLGFFFLKAVCLFFVPSSGGLAFQKIAPQAPFQMLGVL